MKTMRFCMSLSVRLIAVAILFISGCAPHITNLEQESHSSHLVIGKSLIQAGLDEDHIRKQLYTEHTYSGMQWISMYAQYTVAASFDLDGFPQRVIENIPSVYTVEVNWIPTAPTVNVVSLIFIKDQLPLATVEVTQQIRARMAIVIDDVGYNKKALSQALMTNQPITYAVLPYLAYSETLAKLLSDKGHLIILHQPMEATTDMDPGPGAIYMDMTDDQIRKLLDENLAMVPNIKGVNNHMGSAVTADKDKMRVILKHLQEKEMFFLDSVTGQTVCGIIADEIGYPIYKRDVFLDNKYEKQYINGQLAQLMQVALEKGWAIGIGHFNPVTMQCIYELLPELDEKEIKLVYLNELPR